MPIIEVDHVTKEFRLGQQRSLKRTLLELGERLRGRDTGRPPFKALDDVSFSVEPGEVLGIIGHNGAGKSTLLKILAGISKPTRGRVAVRGKVAPLIEVGAGLVPDLTGRENIFVNGAILGMRWAEIQRKFEEIVAFAELEAFIDTPVKRYSSGMQVRLGLAIATTVEADILIVDEVLAVGDLAFQRRCFDRMEDLIERRGRTVLIVGHNVRQIERISERMLLITGGRITRDGSPTEVSKLFYEQVQSQRLAQLGTRPIDHLPKVDTGEVEVLSVELYSGDAHTPTRQLSLNEGAVVRIHFRLARALERVEIHVGVHTPDFVYVFSSGTRELAEPPSFDAGEHAVQCAFGAVPLKPGPYFLRLSFLNRAGQQLWYGEGLCPFAVLPGKAKLTGKPEMWLVDVPAAWSFGNQARPGPRRSIAAGSA